MHKQATALLVRPVIVALRYTLTFVSFACSSLIFLSIPASVTASEASRSIVFILSGESPIYDRVAKATEKYIINGCNATLIDCDSLVFKYIIFDNIRFEEINQAFLTISLGIKAANQIGRLQHTGKTLHAMLPYLWHEISHSNVNKPIAEIYIDQPYMRYFDLIQGIIPRARRVGLLIHENNLDQINTVTKTANQRGFSLKTSIVSSKRNAGEALSYLLNDIDVLLALPDPRIHNSLTISHILTTAYRNNIPVIGFSSAYVKAGAAAAVYTSPDDISHQISDAVLEFLANGKIENHSQQARYFSVTSNFEVTRSLGLPSASSSETKKIILQEAAE